MGVLLAVPYHQCSIRAFITESVRVHRPSTCNSVVGRSIGHHRVRFRSRTLAKGARVWKRQNHSRGVGGVSERGRSWFQCRPTRHSTRSEEHTSELQSLMRISYAVFCLKKKNKT